jgi:hypothetical protein
MPGVLRVGNFEGRLRLRLVLRFRLRVRFVLRRRLWLWFALRWFRFRLVWRLRFRFWLALRCGLRLTLRRSLRLGWRLHVPGFIARRLDYCFFGSRFLDRLQFRQDLLQSLCSHQRQFER